MRDLICDVICSAKAAYLSNKCKWCQRFRLASVRLNSLWNTKKIQKFK